MSGLGSAFTATLKFDSDWHIGLGHGKVGAIDGSVRRDSSGLPYVPAKTLTGLWRTACEQVAQILDQEPSEKTPHSTWQEWVAWLFGEQPSLQDAPPGTPAGGPDREPRPAALSIGPAQFTEELRRAAVRYPALAQAAVTVRPGVKIDPDTLSAEDHHFRLIEVAARDAQLTSRVRMQSGEAIPLPAEILLRLGATLVTSIGGHRNRGLGRVTVNLPPSKDPLPEALRKLGSLPELPRRKKFPRLQFGTPRAAHPQRYALSFRVITPVIITDTVRGNVIISRDSIPGTALLGPVLAKDSSGRKHNILDIRLGDAVPAVFDQGKYLPGWSAPKVWVQADKGTGELVNGYHHAQNPRKRYRAMSGRIAQTSASQWTQVTSSQRISTHAVMDDNSRRPTKESGGVYVYQGIAPGTILQSEVTLSGADLWLAEGQTLQVGRSRKDDFGQIEIIAITPIAKKPTEKIFGSFSLWCLSDILLRNERQQYDPSPTALAAALGRSWGVTLTPLAAATSADGTEKTGYSVSRRDGFTMAWGRPRSSLPCLAAGSVFTFTTDAVIPGESIAQLETWGIGERTAEGFGQVAINPQAITQPRPTLGGLTGRSRPANPRAAADPNPRREIHHSERIAWRRAIRQDISTMVMDCHGSQPSPVDPQIREIYCLLENLGNSQLGQLRTVLAQSPATDRSENLNAWCSRRKEREDLAKKLTELYSDLPGKENIWAYLDTQDYPVISLSNNSEEARRAYLRDELRHESATLLIVEAIRFLSTASSANNPKPEANSHRENP